MPDDSSSSASIIDPKTLIRDEYTIPYLASFPPNTSKRINYSRLQAARISAVMFFGGELYDAGHRKKAVYLNPNLPELTKQCEAAGVPYGLYVHVRAKNEAEADEECRALYYILAHYPPVLGIWLSLKTNNLRVMNDAILEVYYKYINKWGLGQRCGLYLDHYQLDDITWTNFQERYYLWLISPLSVYLFDDELLLPQWFEVD